MRPSSGLWSKPRILELLASRRGIPLCVPRLNRAPWAVQSFFDHCWLYEAENQPLSSLRLSSRRDEGCTCDLQRAIEHRLVTKRRRSDAVAHHFTQ
jgi:hypothetical protein